MIAQRTLHQRSSKKIVAKVGTKFEIGRNTSTYRQGGNVILHPERNRVHKTRREKKWPSTEFYEEVTMCPQEVSRPTFTDRELPIQIFIPTTSKKDPNRQAQAGLHRDKARN